MIGNWLEICGDKGARKRSEGLSPVIINSIKKVSIPNLN
jgi:para-aminobenzoate synthetase component 2